MRGILQNDICIKDILKRKCIKFFISWIVYFILTSTGELDMIQYVWIPLLQRFIKQILITLEKAYVYDDENTI